MSRFQESRVINNDVAFPVWGEKLVGDFFFFSLKNLFRKILRLQDKKRKIFQPPRSCNDQKNVKKMEGPSLFVGGVFAEPLSLFFFLMDHHFVSFSNQYRRLNFHLVFFEEKETKFQKQIFFSRSYCQMVSSCLHNPCFFFKR